MNCPNEDVSGNFSIPGARQDDGSMARDDAVDEALIRLAALEDAPLAEHVAVFEAVHAALQDRLADTEG